MRFVQLSDLHLGSSMELSALDLPAAKRDQRRRELSQTLQNACRLARDERAAVVLLPGDLFDHEGVSGDTLAEAAATLAALQLPVVITPGNHDFYSPSSYYNPEFARGRHGLVWPPNVHVLAGVPGRQVPATANSPQERAGWLRLHLPELPGVAFTGVAFTHHTALGERRLARAPAPELGVLNVLIFHGSRLGHVPPGKASVLPFSDEELEQAGYDYAALGHYHSGSIIRSIRSIRGGAERILGAYSGCPAGRGLDETGPKSALVGELAQDGVSLRAVPVEQRVIHDLRLDCSEIAYNAALLDRIDERLREAGCRACDIVYLRLVGRQQRTLDPRLPADFLEDRLFHLKLDGSQLTPDYDLESLRSGAGAEMTEGRFVRAIDVRLAQATTDDERRLLRRALSYGLDALIAKHVSPRYE